MVHEGSIVLLSLGAYLNSELPMKVWGMRKSEQSAHSCDGRSQPLWMTQPSAVPPWSPPTPPHRGGQASVSEAPRREQPDPKDSSEQVARVQGIDQGLHPSLCSSKIAFLRTGQDKVGEAVPVLLGLSERNGKKALRPWRAGVGPLVYGEDSQHPAGR